MAMMAAIGAGKLGAAQGQKAPTQKPHGPRAKSSANFGELLKRLIDTQAAAQVGKSHDGATPNPPAAPTAAAAGINLRA
jgi:hypothetical protein